MQKQTKLQLENKQNKALVQFLCSQYDSLLTFQLFPYLARHP